MSVCGRRYATAVEWTPSRIRLFREVGLCLPREKFAKELGFTKRTIGNAERGSCALSLSLRRAMDEALEKATEAQRERFFAILPTDAGGASLHSGLPGVVPVARPGPLSLGGGQWQRRNPVTPEAARELLAMSGSYRRCYQTMPAAALLSASRAHLSVILNLHPGWQPPPVRRELLRAVGQSATTSAMLLYSDLERYAEALPYLDVAQDAARENDDPDLAALVLVCRAYLTQFSGGSPALAAEFADAGVSVSINGAARPTTRGLAAAISSRQLAVLGDERGSRTRLDIAREAMAGYEPDPAGTEVCTFDPTMVTYYESGNLVKLGRYGDALAVCETVLAELEPTLHRNRCAALLNRAEAHLASGQVDAGCADALAALDIAMHTEYGHGLARVRRIAQAALPTNADAARRLWAEVLGVTPPSMS